MYRNPDFAANEQPSDQLLQHHFRFCVLHRMRSSGPPPTLQDFEDDFDFRGPVMDGGQEFWEIYIVERLIGMDDGSEDCDIHDYHGVCCDNKSLTT